MKTLLSLLITISLVSGLTAGNLFIETADTVAQATPGESVVFDGYVHNLSNSVMIVQLTRTVNDIPENWTTTLCFGANCFPPHVSAPDPVAIDPGDSLFFDIVFNTDSIPGTGKAVLKFKDLLTGIADSVSFEVSTKVEPPFSFDFADTVEIIRPGESFTFETYIHNLTDSVVIIQVNRLQNLIPEDWSTTMCLGVSCYPPGVSEVNSAIMPGDSVFFDIVFSTGLSPDTGQVLLQFTDLMSGQMTEQSLTVVTQLPEPVIEIAVMDSSVTGQPGQELITKGMVYNISDTTQKVVLVKHENNLPDDWSSQLCLDSCFTPETDTVSTDLSKGDSLQFGIRFLTSDQPATASVNLLIFAEGNEDTLKQTFYAETQSTALEPQAQFNPQKFTLLGNYPNPFNSETTIRFFSPEQLSSVTLQLFSVSGKLIAERKTGAAKSGLNHLRFNANHLASGVYLYRIQAKSLTGKRHQGTGKFLLIK